MPNTHKDWSSNNVHSFNAGEKTNGIPPVEDWLFLSKDPSLTIRFSPCAPSYLSKGTEKLCPHENLYVIIEAVFITAKLE